MVAGASSVASEDENFASWRQAIPSASRYGYGIMSFPHESRHWIGHTGRQAGASSIVVLVPEERLAIAVMTNVKGWSGYLGFVRKLHATVEPVVEQNAVAASR